MKYQTLKKRIISSLLAFSMLVTPSITSFADGTGGSSQGNDGSGVTTVGGGDFGVNPPTGRIGLRLSLVNSDNPSEVISVDKNGNPVVMDLLYVDARTYIEYTDLNHATNLDKAFMYSAVKTQNLDAKNNIARVYYNQAVYELDIKEEGEPITYDEIPSWAEYTGSKYYSKGSEFVDWCKRDEAGNIQIGEDGLLYVTVDVNGKQIAVQVADDRSLTITNGEDSYRSELGKGEITKSYESYKSFLEKKGDGLFQGPVADDGLYAEYITWLDLMRMDGKLTDGQYSELSELVTSYYNKAIGKTSAKVENKNSLMASIKNVFTPLKADAAPDIMDENQTQSGGGGQHQIEGEDTTVNNMAWINRLMDIKVDDNRVLKTKSMWENNTDKIADATENWVLLVEPIVYMTIFKAGDDSASALLHTKIYGTISNFVEALDKILPESAANKAEYGWFNWKAINGPLWSALTVSGTSEFEIENSPSGKGRGFRFNNGDFLSVQKENLYGKYVSISDLADWNQWQSHGDSKYKIGYGVNVWYKGQLTTTSETHTWDKETYRNGEPGPAPDPTNLPKEDKTYTDKNINKKFKISKWYYIEDPVTKEQYVYDVNTRIDTPHKVLVENEEGSNFIWQVERWATGKEDKVPVDGDLSATFEEYYNSNVGKQNGKGPNVVTVSADDGDKVLYVKLVMRLKTNNDLTIKKYYPDKPVETEVIQKVPNYDANEEGYVYVEDKQTPEPPKEAEKWEDTPSGTPGSTPNIPVDEDTKTIYIKYDKPDQVSPDVITLHQNELAHVFSLSDMAELVTQTHSFSSKEGGGHDEHDCGGCEEDDDGDSYCPGHPCSWERYIDDDNYSYVISNKENYSETNFIGANGAFASVETGIVDDSGSLGIGGGTTSGLTPNLNFVV